MKKKNERKTTKILREKKKGESESKRKTQREKRRNYIEKVKKKPHE